MGTVKIKCDNCGMDFSFEDSMEEVHCIHCGSLVSDRSSARKVDECGDGFEVTLVYIKPLLVGSPMAIVTVDGRDEIQLTSRRPVKIRLPKGEHSFAVRGMSIMATIKYIGSFEVIIDRDCTYTLRLDGSKNAEFTRTE